MNASDDYCELCDLPLSQCVHGRPPSVPEKVVKPKAAARTTPKRTPTAKKAASAPPSKVVPRRFTPPDAFKPLIVTVLQEAGGELANDELFERLEVLAEGALLPGDHELTPEGELRWRYAARRARVALINDGLMTKGTPGFWQLA